MQMRFIGVGISNYDSYERLPAAGPGVERVGKFLAETATFVTEYLNSDPTEEEVRARLKTALPKNAIEIGSALVVLWSGHAEVTPDDRLRLLARNSLVGDAVELSPDWLAERAAQSGASHVFLMIDTCHAGAGAVHALARVYEIWQQNADPNASLLILCSSVAMERALDGQFVTRLLDVLEHGAQSPGLDGWSRHNARVTAATVVATLRKSWPVAESAKPLRVDYNSDDGIPLFRNPLYQPDARSELVEHLIQAASGRSPDETGNFFTGRVPQVEAVAGWLAAKTSGVRLITGPAGSGKSALAGHVAERSGFSASFHLRGATLDQTSSDIGKQLVKSCILAREPANRSELLAMLKGRTGEPPVIVLDGLDEARLGAKALVSELIKPLSEVANVLVTSRPLIAGEGDKSLLEVLAPTATIDLGAPALADQTTADVQAYVHKRLTTGERFQADAQAVTAAVVELARDSEHRGDDGAFLFARILTSQLRESPIDTSEPGWLESLSQSLEAAFERDLSRSSDPDWARVVLRALAYGYGKGMPMDVWLAVAGALDNDERNPGQEDLERVTGDLGRYIVEDGANGRAVYRLAHQRFIDILRPADVVKRDEVRERKVARAIVARYRHVIGQSGAPEAHAYLWKYATLHCSDAEQEGVTLFRALATEEPRLESDVEPVLFLAGRYLYWKERFVEALPLAEESVALARVAVGGSWTMGRLVRRLVALAETYRGLARDAEAIAAAEEAAALAESLERDDDMISDVRKAHECLLKTSTASYERDESELRERVVEEPGLLPRLASATAKLGNLYRVARRLDLAVTLLARAADMSEGLPSATADDVHTRVMTLVRLADCYDDQDRLDDAVAALARLDVIFAARQTGTCQRE